MNILCGLIANTVFNVASIAFGMFYFYPLLTFIKTLFAKERKAQKVWNKKLLHREMTRWNRNEPKVSLLFRN